MTKIQDLRQLAHTIKTETKVGGNTADRVGSAFEGVADALEGTEQIAEMDKAVQDVQQQVEASKAQIQSLVNALPVVQQTGDSTTSVMSQKAVTENLAKASEMLKTVTFEYGTSDISSSSFGYYKGTVGSKVVDGSGVNWAYKLPAIDIHKGDIVSIVTTGYGIGNGYVITDSDGTCLEVGATSTINITETIDYVDAAKLYVCCKTTEVSSFKVTIVRKSQLDKMKDELKADIEAIDEKFDAKEIVFSKFTTTGYRGTVGSTVIEASNPSFKGIKIAVTKGDIFEIDVNSYGNAHGVLILDSDNKVLFNNHNANSIRECGILEIWQEKAAFLCVSGDRIYTLKKLAYKHDDAYEVSLNSKAGISYLGEFIYNSSLSSISLPIYLKDGDIVKIDGAAYASFRSYSIESLITGNILQMSDIDIKLKDLLLVAKEECVVYVNGTTSSPAKVKKIGTESAKALLAIGYGKKIAFLGDSITSYQASDMAEFVRGYLGCIYLHNNTILDYGNFAEGNATACDKEGTEITFGYADGKFVDGAYVNRVLSNEVLKLLQHTTVNGEQITWHIASNNKDYNVDTSLGVGTGFVDDKPDVIYIAMGTNDNNTTDDFDTVISQDYGSLTRKTICSAMRWAIETLQNAYPEAIIIACTAIHRGTRNLAETKAKNEIIKKICDYMAIPVVDSFSICGFNPYTYSIYSSDMIHPNTKTARIGNSIAARVKSYLF